MEPLALLSCEGHLGINCVLPISERKSKIASCLQWPTHKPCFKSYGIAGKIQGETLLFQGEEITEPTAAISHDGPSVEHGE